MDDYDINEWIRIDELWMTETRMHVMDKRDKDELNGWENGKLHKDESKLMNMIWMN